MAMDTRGIMKGIHHSTISNTSCKAPSCSIQQIHDMYIISVWPSYSYFVFLSQAQDDVLNDIERGLDNQKQQGLLMGSELERQKVYSHSFFFVCKFTTYLNSSL